MENCVNWSRLNGDIYRKCPQVYALEAINRESKRKIAAHEIQAYHLNRVNTELQAELEKYKALEENDWDLRCVDIPTGGDDYSTEWRIIEHYQAKPKERIIGHGRTPIEAIKQAGKG